MTILETLQNNKESINFISTQLNTKKDEFPSYIVLIQNLSNLTNYMNFFYNQNNKNLYVQKLSLEINNEILFNLNEFSSKIIECIALYLSIYVKDSSYEDLEKFIISRKQWEKESENISITAFIEEFNKTVSELLIASSHKMYSDLTGTKTSLYVIKPLYKLNQLSKTIQSIIE